jgi:hypothetical protein
MQVGIIQSNYLPWRGYFDFIASVDLFIVHDDLQFTKGDWRNRNRIKTAQGLRWLTVPVHYRHTAQLICDTRIDHSKDWPREHLNAIRAHYAGAPFLRDVLTLVEEPLRAGHATIADLNVALLTRMCRYLDIHTPIRQSRAFNPSGAKTERLLGLLAATGATAYLSGPSARNYLDESQFRAAGIRLEYKAYDYQEYPQLWGPFESAVSIVDPIANCGPRSRDFLRSRRSNLRAAA